jgi:hypothetical protein
MKNLAVRLLGCAFCALVPIEVFAQFAPKLEQPEITFGPGKISAKYARQHIGEVTTICGLVTNITEPTSTPDKATGRPTSINLGEPGFGGYNADFVIIVSQADAEQFPRDEIGGHFSKYFGHFFCTTGLIQSRTVSNGQWILPFTEAHGPADMVQSAEPRPLQQPAPCGPRSLGDGRITGRPCYNSIAPPAQPR